MFCPHSFLEFLQILCKIIICIGCHVIFLSEYGWHFCPLKIQEKKQR
jgi:hypothetical protein